MEVNSQPSQRLIKQDLRPIEVLDVEFIRGGMGDSIARLPVIKYLLEEVPHIKSIRLFAQDYLEPLVAHCFPTDRVKFIGFSKKKEELAARPSKAAKMTDVIQHTTMRTHLTQHAFNTIIDQTELPPNVYNYVQLDPKKLPPSSVHVLGRYVVISTGFTAKVREWPAKEINKVTSWLVDRGITPVFLGKTESVFRADAAATKAGFSDEIDFSVGVNLIDKTNLMETASIIYHANAIVGVDNGLLHLAGMTNIPIIAGYTSVDPVHRLPIRWNKMGWNCKVIEPSISCKFCQTQANFLYDFDFRNCYYGDYVCTSQMYGEKFIEKLKEIL